MRFKTQIVQRLGRFKSQQTAADDRADFGCRSRNTYGFEILVGIQFLLAAVLLGVMRRKHMI